MSGRFAGQSALVTGGGSGLGRMIAEALAREGAAVVVADSDGDATKAAVQAITDDGGTAIPSVGDVRRMADVQAMVEAARAAGPLKVVVLSAAVEVRRSVVECTDEEWRLVLDTNLKGPFLCMHEAIPAMQDGGAVIALGSVLGLMAAPGFPAYTASKGALVNLCKQAAIEHAADGVRVNVVAPSATDTGLFIKTAERSGNAEEVKRRVAEGSPMGRLGRGGEVVDTVLFLASDAAAYISGTVIPVDGAAAARRIL
ncbi:MAG TPA: SDR family oxidoreductase [Acidimicrobiales bacterium]|nr:SDR family oxidoreductase [Acidimicrobiales bacterium]